MKKLLLIMCVCAILLTGVSCNTDADKKTDKKTEKTTQSTKGSDDTNNTEDTENGDDLIIGTPVEPITPDTTDTDSSSDIIGINPEDVQTGETDVDPGTSEDDPVDVVTPSEPVVPDVLTEGGTEQGLWPSESIPEDVPAYEDYKEMYTATHTDSGNSEEWYLSFDSTEKDYEDWVKKLEEEGYTESDKIVGFWGNGEQILNLMTEEVDGEFCVSIDIFKSKPVEYPEAVSKVFPVFTPSDSTLYGWYVKAGTPNKLSVSYACGNSFDTDLNQYKQALSDAGFTVTADSASKVVDGKTYTVRYGDSVSRYEDAFEFEY